jgi:hypothetical protein
MFQTNPQLSPISVEMRQSGQQETATTMAQHGII